MIPDILRNRNYKLLTLYEILSCGKMNRPNYGIRTQDSGSKEDERSLQAIAYIVKTV